jgi:hypothetical protein
MDPFNNGIVIGVVVAIVLIAFMQYGNVLNCKAGANMPGPLKNLMNKQEGFVNLYQQQKSLGISSVGPEAVYQGILADQWNTVRS